MVRNVGRLWFGGLLVAGLLGAAACTPRDDAGGAAAPTPTGSNAGETATATGSATPEGPAPILIGAVMAETGLARRLDRPALGAARTQIDRVNAQGGIDGRPVELRSVDSQTELNATFRGARQLVDDGAVALLVSCDFDAAVPALEVARDAGIPAVTPCGTDPRWSESTAWSAGVSVASEGRLLADVIVGAGADTAAVVVDGSDAEMVTQCEAFVDRFGAVGGDVVTEVSYDREFLTLFDPDVIGTEPDLSAVGTAARIVLCGSLPRTGPEMLAVLRERGFDAPVVAGSAMAGTDWLRGDVGDVSFISWGSTFRNDPVDVVNAVVEAARIAIGGSAEGGRMVAGADAMAAILRAVERDPTDPAAALVSLAGEELVVATASWSATDRFLEDRPLRIMRVVGDEAVVDDIVTAP